MAQDLIKSTTLNSDKDETSRWTQEDLIKWPPFGKLTSDEQKLIAQECRQFNSPQPGTVNFQNLLGLKDDGKEIKRILCSKLLRKLDRLQNCDEAINELCDCAKPVLYKKNVVIVQVGSLVDEMLLVVEGKIEIKSNGERHAEEDNCVGDAMDTSSSLPKSTKTIKVVKHVRGFALAFENLENVITKYRLLSAQDARNLVYIIKL